MSFPYSSEQSVRSAGGGPRPTVEALRLSAVQAEMVAFPADRKIFLEGVAGTGKTTAAVARLLRLLRTGAVPESILVLIPQRTLAAPYNDALRGPGAPAGGEASVVTMGGLAQRMVDLFWPLVAERAGFAHPDRPPIFLTLETAQYHMARIVRPLLDRGYFDSITVDRNRLYSQILDNLNKAAVVGFAHTEIAGRLKAAWVGESSQLRVYDEAQACAEEFRNYCLNGNLLDFSLQYEVFSRRLWPLPACRDYLTRRYAHIIADNVEEDTAVAHDILLDWLPGCQSALIIYDREAGFRRFLGTDPLSAARLRTLCNEQVMFTRSFVTSPQVAALGAALWRGLGRRARKEEAWEAASPSRPLAEEMSFGLPASGGAPAPAAPPAPGAGAPAEGGAGPGGVRTSLDFTAHRYHPEMIDWVADEIGRLVHGLGVPPGEIVVLAPFLSGALRFSLENRLQARDVPARSHRPSRALREEPVTNCLLTLAALCHPEWGICPAKADVAHALVQAIDELDLVRGQLLADIAYRVVDGVPTLSSFADIEPPAQERITFLLGGRYEGLRTWLLASQAKARGRTPLAGRPPRGGARERPTGQGQRKGDEQALDHFLSRLFGELLSQPGYGFHRHQAGTSGSLAGAEVTANLIESVAKFREVMAPAAAWSESDLGREYLLMVREGVVAAQYVRSWRRPREDTVLLAPAYTFLMSNRPVDHQFWLDVGGAGWWERLNQPLTHPYVLSRQWPAEVQWTDADEIAARLDGLARLTLGLIRRCRVQIHLGLSELNEQGAEQRGPLLAAIQAVLRANA